MKNQALRADCEALEGQKVWLRAFVALFAYTTALSYHRRVYVEGKRRAQNP